MCRYHPSAIKTTSYAYETIRSITIRTLCLGHEKKDQSNVVENITAKDERGNVILTDNSTRKSSDTDSKASAPHQRRDRNDIVGRTQLPLPSLTGLEQQSQALMQKGQEKSAATARPQFSPYNSIKKSTPQIDTDASPTSEPAPIQPGHPKNKVDIASTTTPKRISWRSMLLTIVACIIIGAAFVFSYSYFIIMPDTQAATSTPQKKASSISVITAPQKNEPYDIVTGITNIHVGVDPMLTISGHSGNVTIHAGNNNAVSINTYDRGTQLTQTHDGQGHDVISIVPQILNENINYDITVPATTRVSITIDSGSMSVKGVGATTIKTSNGTMDIESVRGAVQAETVNSNITLQNITGQMTLRTLHGTIKANMVQGQLNAATQYGDVIVQKAILSNQSALTTSHGSIQFAGTLNPTGSYSLATGSGNISLTLPQNAAFQLQARTQAGSITNAFHSNSVGNTPQAKIVASVNSGSVTVQKQNG